MVAHGQHGVRSRGGVRGSAGCWVDKTLLSWEDSACEGRSTTQEGQVQPTNSPSDVSVADEHLVSHAGVGLLAELADRLGLTAALGRFAVPVSGRARRHPPARVVRDAIVMLADGGDCLSDLRLLTGCQDLLGQVASIPTAWRAIQRLAEEGETGLAGLRLARAHARAVAWRAGAGPAGRLIVDLDGSLIVAHSDRKQGAEGTYKHTFGFHPRVPPAAGLPRPPQRPRRAAGRPAAPGQRRRQRHRRPPHPASARPGATAAAGPPAIAGPYRQPRRDHPGDVVAAPARLAVLGRAGLR
jgi:Transposase DDE domain group 1